MKESKILFSLMAGGILAASLLLFFIWQGNLPEKTLENTELSQNLLVKRENVPPKTAPEPHFTDNLLKPVNNLVRSVEKFVFGTEYVGLFSNQDEKKNVSVGRETSQGVETSQNNTSKVPQLTEEEIFSRLWPVEYRNALITLQDLMIKDGFMLESEKVSHMTSDEHIYAALLKIADYALKQGWVESADFDQLRTGIQELERTISMERTNLRTKGKISNGVLLPGGQRINKTPLTKQSFFSTIIDGLKYSLTVNTANAQIPGVPGWHTTPDCYKDLAPVNPVPGVNLWAFCCNCGLLCTPFGCVGIPDCGPFSLACNVPLGCLNRFCGGWPNAIWDSFSNPLGTGICGCG